MRSIACIAGLAALGSLAHCFSEQGMIAIPTFWTFQPFQEKPGLFDLIQQNQAASRVANHGIAQRGIQVFQKACFQNKLLNGFGLCIEYLTDQIRHDDPVGT